MGGHGAGVTEQLNYRRSQSRKRPGQEKTYGSFKNKKWEDPIKATPEQLAAIRSKLRRQARRKKTIRITLFIGLLAMMILVLGIWA